MEKYILKNDKWYLLSLDQCGEADMRGYPHHSFIWHTCRSDGNPNFKGMWRLSIRNLGVPCPACDQVCPDEIQTVWLFLNEDILAGVPGLDRY